MASARMEEGHLEKELQITPEAGRASSSENGESLRRELLTLSDDELASLGFVKAGNVQHQAPAAVEFSGGLLPDSAQAGTYGASVVCSEPRFVFAA